MPDEYFPLEHGVHSAVPFVSLYVPALHARHASPFGPVYPWLHEQLTTLPLPAGEYVKEGQSAHVSAELCPVRSEYVPCTHGEHAIEPLTPLYVPTGQAEQTPPSSPVYPTLQMQLLLFLLPGSEYANVGHIRHRRLSFKPLISE